MPYLARLLLVISLISPLGVFHAYGADAILGNLYNDSTISFGRIAPSKPLPADKLRLLIWNVHKGEHKRLPQDFSGLSFGADVILFQETVSTPSFIKNITAANNELQWTMAKSFQMLNLAYTGVATGSRVQPLREEVVLSNVKEPITETSKAILISTYGIEDSYDTLMVANIHSINFVRLESYKVQIRQLLEKIQHHKGPLIIAGDFNTWSSDRMNYLKKAFAPMGLSHLQTPVAGILDLDHIFVRGMKVSFIFDLSHIDSSDHAPLMVDLLFEKYTVRSHENHL